MRDRARLNGRLNVLDRTDTVRRPSPDSQNTIRNEKSNKNSVYVAELPSYHTVTYMSICPAGETDWVMDTIVNTPSIYTLLMYSPETKHAGE